MIGSKSRALSWLDHAQVTFGVPWGVHPIADMPQPVDAGGRVRPPSNIERSRLLQQRSRQKARKLMTANEAGRRKLSLQLNEEIAQPLLGIHVRLLVLKNEAAASHANLAKEIALTRRLVMKSLKTICRLARTSGPKHEV
jgi:hypothetical protein